MKKIISLLLVLTFAFSMLSGCSKVENTPNVNNKPDDTTKPDESTKPEDTTKTVSNEPIKISLFYPDNATLPFKDNWLVVKEAEKKFNVKLNFEPIPIADYPQKVSLSLNTGKNTPDVILGDYTKGENASLALNGALVPLSDYRDLLPNFFGKVKEFNLEQDIEDIKLKDDKFYYLPSLYDKPFYDGGLILREDILKEYNLPEPKTFDDLYAILKAYKDKNPDSYPLTILAGPRVLYRMTMPSWGISLGKNAAAGTSNTLSWDYSKGEYFTAAIGEEYREYMKFFNKLYKEGLLDPEMKEPIDGDKWTTKLATGVSIASYAYYDQIGGIETNSDIEGIKFQMYPPLEGPAGAHHQQKSSTNKGILIPIGVKSRPDFEEVIKKIDELFFSDEAALLWCLGVEGETYTMDGDTIKYSDEVINSPDGIYKSMQLKYGCGADPTQLVWVNAREMSKYDENYASINKKVASMKDAIQKIPPTPLFDDLVAEEATTLQSPLYDTFDLWNDGFMTGSKSLDTDWDEYVKEMQDNQYETFCDLYNSNIKK